MDIGQHNYHEEDARPDEVPGQIAPGEDYYLPEGVFRPLVDRDAERKKARREWRIKRRKLCENLESLIIAFILAIVIRQYVAEAYKIPTGSMQPTLMGDNDARQHYGDRIVVDKLYYLIRSVKRWDVVVFKYPYATYTSHWPKCKEYLQDYELDKNKTLNRCDLCHSRNGIDVDISKSRYVTKSRRNYVKRCVGLPGETIQIKHGDIYIKNDTLDFEIPQKPDRIQEGLWIRSYFCDFSKESPFRDQMQGSTANSIAFRNEQHWNVPTTGWHTENGKLVVEADSGIPVRLALLNIKDYIVIEDNHILENQGQSGSATVGDIKIEAEITFASQDSRICFVISEDDCVYRLALSPGEGGCYAEWEINGGTTPDDKGKEEIPVNLDAKKEIRVTFANVDDSWVVKLAESSYTLRHKFEKGRIVAGNAKSSASVDVSVAPVSIQRLDVFRDIYYTNAGKINGDPYEISKGHYFALGDNSAFSSDSRSWGTFAHESIVGRAIFVFYPIGPIIDWEKWSYYWSNRLKIIK